jgi:hypothetical protein
MGEVTSFRQARAPQRSAEDEGKRLALPETAQIGEWLDAGDNARENASAYLADRDLDTATRFAIGAEEAEAEAAILARLRSFDRELLRNGNAADWDDLAENFEELFDGDPENVVERDSWGALFERLSDTLVAILLARGDPALGADVVRLLLVMGLVRAEVEAAAALDADAVFSALRWRTIALPPGVLLLTSVMRSILARRPGVSDLYVVREEWNRYEPGEIAHIENVLQGEVKRSIIEKTDERETTAVLDESTTRSVQQDSQTTDRFELKTSSQVDTSLALHIEGKVDTSGVYGPTKVDTHLGGTFDYSVEESNARAATQAREIVSRAASSIEESVRRQRTERSLTRTRTMDRHDLNNAEGDDHTIGIYRWVDKIQTVQIFKYPHRLLYEFQVPEPGAFIRWLNAQPRQGQRRPLTPFTLNGQKDGAPLIAAMISGMAQPVAGEINYLQLADRYDVQGLEPPPINRQVHAAITNEAPDLDVQNNNQPPVYKTSNVTIPDGYEGFRFAIFAEATNGTDAADPTGWLEIAVGTDFPSTQQNDNDPQQIWRWQGVNVFKDLKYMNFRQPVTGQVPVLLATDDTRGLMANLQVFCRPDETTVNKWRLKVFDQILGAYLALRRQEEDAAARAAIQAGVVIDGESASRNAEVVREEIKHSTIELLMGERFSGRDAMQAGPNNTADRMDLDRVRATAQEIQFLEEAFEWENLSFVLYPYYWADAGKWVDLERISSPDADFDRFLRAGSARVVVPARPGFEAATQLYTTFGLLWGGGSVLPALRKRTSLACDARDRC